MQVGSNIYQYSTATATNSSGKDEWVRYLEKCFRKEKKTDTSEYMMKSASVVSTHIDFSTTLTNATVIILHLFSEIMVLSTVVLTIK